MLSKGLSEEVTFWLSHKIRQKITSKQQRKAVQTEGRVSAKVLGLNRALHILRTEGVAMCLGQRERAGTGHGRD